MRNIPYAALQRFNQLQNEEQEIRKTMAGGQEGTSIPRLYYATDSFIVNPSSVGTSMLARMVETDDSVSSSVQFKTLMILAKMGDYHHPDKKISEFVNGFLKKLERPTWLETMEAVLSSGAFGFSISEICWGLNKDLEKIPVRIPTYHPSTIAFEVDDSGQITDEGVIQFTYQYSQFANPNMNPALVAETYGWKVKNPFTTPNDRLMPTRMPFIWNYGIARIPRNKVIHSTNLPMFAFGSPYGKTAVRTAHLAWQLKVFVMKQLGIAVKRQATNTLWGTAPQGQAKVTSTDHHGKKSGDLITASEALRQMLADRETDDALVTGPETAGYKITNLANAANIDQIVNVIDKLDVRIFRCFLLPSLVMTDGSAGSRSLGDKHFQIVDKIADQDADKFGITLINDLVRPAIRENFGTQDDYGKFTKRPQSIEERERLSNMFTTLGNGGWLKNYVKGDMEYVRTSLSLPDDTDTTADIERPSGGTGGGTDETETGDPDDGEDS